MQCPKPGCNTDIRDHEAFCPGCGYAIPPPNVRAAQKPEEVAALNRRLRDAEASALRRGCGELLPHFRAAILRDSQAVVCRDLSVAQRLLSSENELYATFYQSVRGGARRPENNLHDPIRERIDIALFPHYHEHIRFAALSLDGRGLIGYGNCCIVLKNVSIEDRATVFEDNSASLLRKLKIGIADPIPFGYRATWGNRDILAAAKLSAGIETTTKATDFPGLLVQSTPDRKGDSFIEVHIYGPFTVHSVERVLINSGLKRRANSVIATDLRRKLRGFGIPVEAYS